tara:strand:+ start:5224 stop:5601 length:378 start_codon:yes stop_codon:yes gene_type:complete
MTTPILKITEVANNQVDQYLTVNEAMRIMEAASDGFLFVDLAAGDATITNLAPDYDMLRYQTFIAENNTVSREIVFSANPRSFKVDNGGSFAVDVTIGATTVSVPAGGLYSFYANGTTDGLKRAQ